MRVLVTTGSTEVPIDKVRAITNIFTGKTGTNIAEYFAAQGDDVTLITSSPHLVTMKDKVKVIPYRTYQSLVNTMREEIEDRRPHYDAVIHSAAVSDYSVEGTYVMHDGKLGRIDDSGKIASSHSELYLKLVPTMKIVDRIRHPWNFMGTLVKFKLQVGVSEPELLRIARKSMAASRATFIVANTLDAKEHGAFILANNNSDVTRVTRAELPKELHRLLGWSTS